MDGFEKLNDLRKQQFNQLTALVHLISLSIFPVFFLKNRQLTHNISIPEKSIRFIVNTSDYADNGEFKGLQVSCNSIIN